MRLFVSIICISSPGKYFKYVKRRIPSHQVNILNSVVRLCCATNELRSNINFLECCVQDVCPKSIRKRIRRAGLTESLKIEKVFLKDDIVRLFVSIICISSPGKYFKYVKRRIPSHQVDILNSVVWLRGATNELRSNINFLECCVQEDVCPKSIRKRIQRAGLTESLKIEKVVLKDEIVRRFVSIYIYLAIFRSWLGNVLNLLNFITCSPSQFCHLLTFPCILTYVLLCLWYIECYNVGVLVSCLMIVERETRSCNLLL